MQENQVDAHIRLGKVPDNLSGEKLPGYGYQASANLFLLNCPEIARYLVRDGNEIVVQVEADAIESDVRVFLLGSGFGALLHQRQLLVMHASVICSQHGAVLFSGPSGAGKSTLLAEMLARGYKMMVDDVCAVELDSENTPMVIPGYPRTRLWADSAAKLDIATEGLPRTRQMLEKFECQLPDQFHITNAPMHRMYLLNSSADDRLELQELPTLEKFAVVLQNTYRSAFLDGLEMRQPHFTMASQVAASVSIVKATRPSSGFLLTELADMIEADFNN